MQKRQPKVMKQLYLPVAFAKALEVTADHFMMNYAGILVMAVREPDSDIAKDMRSMIDDQEKKESKKRVIDE